jgi:hypothetical protein
MRLRPSIYYRGLHRSEVMGLRWPEADLDIGVIRVVVALHLIKDKGLSLLPTKAAPTPHISATIAAAVVTFVAQTPAPTPAPFPKDLMLVLLGGVVVLVGLVVARFFLRQRR